jgi:TolB protein
MRNSHFSLCLVLVCAFVLCYPRLEAQTAEGRTGIFEDHTDVGTVLHPGAVEYDSAKQTYTISGSGENMWLGGRCLPACMEEKFPATSRSQPTSAS